MGENSTTGSSVDRATSFERGVVFRVARVFFLALAILGALAFLAGGAIGLNSLVPDADPEALEIAPIPARAPIDYRMVQAELPPERNAAPSAVTPPTTPSPEGSAPSTARSETRLDVLLKELQSLFPEPPYSWLDVTEKRCVAPTSFGCLRSEYVVTVRGVRPRVLGAFNDLPPAERQEYLEVAVRILKEAPVDKRLAFLEAIIITEEKARARHESLQRKHQQSVEANKLEHEARVFEAKLHQKRSREYALYGMLLGFALLIAVSLLLAILAIERQTRAFQDWARVAQQKADGGRAVADDAAAVHAAE